MSERDDRREDRAYQDRVLRRRRGFVSLSGSTSSWPVTLRLDASPARTTVTANPSTLTNGGEPS